MPAVSACPDADRLQQFVLGLLPEPDSLAVEGHLSACEQCAGTVQQLPDNDTFISALRSQAPGQPAGAVVEGLMKRLRGLKAAAPGPEDTAAESPPTPPPVEADAGDVTEEMSVLLGPAQAAGEIGRVGGYRVLRQLGAGGMGLVFQAEDVALLRPVALKVMRPRLARDAQARERFVREAQAAAKIKSDHVVTIYQVGEDRGTPFLAMEFLPGEPMDKWLRRGRRPNVPQLLRLAREMALGLAAAHERGLIHRDVKPGNVWLEAPTGRVKLLDFGLARPVKQDTHLTQSGVIVGTPAYMAPEQARGQQVDHRADLFSLGCVLYQLCTGRLPFTGENVMGVLMALATDTPRPVREWNPDIPERLADLVARLLAKAPDERPASAREVVALVQAIERERTAPSQPSALSVPVASPVLPAGSDSNPWADLTMPQPSETQAPTVPASPRRRWPFAVAAGVLLALFGGAVAVYELTYKTPHGNLIVQIDDKDVEARFKNGELRLYDADGQLKYTLKPSERNESLAPGEYHIKVTGADGLTLNTEKFELRKNDKVTVRVLLDQKVIAAKKDKPSADADRQVAEWVLKNGGAVFVGIDGKSVKVDAVGKLPAKPFRLENIILSSPSVKPDDLLDNVGSLTNLWQLDLVGTALGDADLERLASVPNLEMTLTELDVGAGDRDRITDAGLAHLKRFRNLHSITLHCPKITGASLRHLRELKLNELHLSGTSVTDTGLEQLRSLPLYSLTLRDSSVGDAGLEHLKTMPELHALGLENLKVTDAGLTTLAALSKVTSLGLDRLPITDGGLARLKGMVQLRQLGVANAKVTDAGLAHLAALKDLEKLGIVAVPVTDAGLEHLKGLAKLQGLDLRGTKVTAGGVKKLAAALPGCSITSDVGNVDPARAGGARPE
jgi:serine/threonine protein kinase